MNGPALVQAVLSAGVSHDAFWVWSVLLIVCGLLRAFERRGWSKRPARGRAARGRADSPRVAAPTLNAIELALLAELSLEQARANDEVASDGRQRPETRRSASESAMAWRERAGWFQSQARRQAQHPMLSGPRLSYSSYTGPERLKQMRRGQARRTGPWAADERERCVRADRRRRDRRSRELASG